MNISAQKVVSLSYELRTSSSNGDIVENVTSESPLTFLAGSGNLLPKFEEQLMGLKDGDSFDFTLVCDDAYGQLDKNAVIELPLDVFMVDGEIDHSLLHVGNSIPMRDSSGRRLNGLVREVSDSAVKMDFNHPLAGDDLYFKGTVTEVREASEEEIQHGHIHQVSSCDSCGSDEHGCNGGCH
jgi:FKBP-type peptidyl-prolyl cis-trans isomerase SlyD